MRAMVTCLGVLLISSCSFDVSGTALEDGGSSNDAFAGDGGADARGDAGPCPGGFSATISVNGVTEAPGTNQPFVHVLIGDSVELSAAGSCADSGISSIEWQISPVDDTRLTALPNLSAETITVYSMVPEKYTVTLTLRDGSGAAQTEMVFGFETHDFQAMPATPGNAETRDVSLSADHLWVAGKSGPFRASLSNLGAGYTDVNQLAVGDTIPTELQVVHYDTAADMVWFAHKDAQSTVWKVDLGLSNAVAVDFTTALEIADAQVENIISLDPGVELATSAGVTGTLDNTSFTTAFEPSPLAVSAVAQGGGSHWAGGFALFDVEGGGVSGIDILGNGLGTDDKILGLVVDSIENELWVTSDDKHVVRVDNANGTIIADYVSSNSNLPDARMRDIAIETSGRSRGDVWVATDKGIARFKRDRLLWILYDANEGLDMLINITGIAIDAASGRRGVFAASNKGVVYSRVP